MSAGPSHIFIYEPRVEGHHVSNLQFVASDLLGAGHRLTLALDPRPDALGRLRAGLGEILDRVRVLAAEGETAGERIKFLARGLAQSGADSVFLTNFDEIASPLLRRAALGMMPPEILRGRLGGSYSRPRFLAGVCVSPNEWLKAAGFNRLLRQGWFAQLLFPDPYFAAALAETFPSVRIAHIPTPAPEDFSTDGAAARRELGIAPDKKVFLFYGGGYRRKGLHLAVAALHALPANSPAFLLCAGEQPDDANTRRNLAELVAQGRALALARYVTRDEEQIVFAASDFVLLPYLRHFGTSGVQSLAAGAGKPVIVSDEQLVGRLVRERGLGLRFRSGDVRALVTAMQEALAATPAQVAGWQAAEKIFARDWSRTAFRTVMVNAFKR
jgi:Glycosyl transferases group 1